MTQETFKQLIEAPASGKLVFSDKVFTKAVIRRSVKIALQYPEFAQEYLDSLSKAMNKKIPIHSIEDLRKVFEQENFTEEEIREGFYNANPDLTRPNEKIERTVQKLCSNNSK